MSTLYKLTNKKNFSMNYTKWAPGVSHTATGKGELCTDGCIHAYTSPYLAVLLNHLHNDYKKYNLWEAEGEILYSDNDIKVGCKTLTTIKKIDPPVFTNNQMIAFAIFCAKETCSDVKWNKWADNWLDGSDRSLKSDSENIFVFDLSANWATEASVCSYQDQIYHSVAHAAFNAVHFFGGKKFNIDLKELAIKAYNFERKE